MKLTVKEEDNHFCKWFTFGQEGSKGVKISEYELADFVIALETVEPRSVMFFHENLGVRRGGESGTIVRLGVKEEPLLKLSLTQMRKLALTLRSSYPRHF